jgi:hypothetical protein
LILPKLKKYLFIATSLTLIVFIASHFNYFQSDNPTSPLFRKNKMILSRHGSLKGYYLVDCNLYKGATLVRSFPGSLCYVTKEGNVFAASKDKLIYLKSADNNIAWKKELPTHHDISVNEVRREVAVPTFFKDSRFDYIHAVSVHNYLGEEVYYWNPLDHIDELSKELGYDLDEYLKNFEDNGKPPNSMSSIKINSVQILKKTDSYPRLPYLKPGNLLINIQLHRLMIIVDRDKNKIVWSFRFGEESAMTGGHSPKLLKNGNIIIYFNEPNEMNRSSWWHKAHFMINFYNRFKFENGKLLIDFYEEGLYRIDITEVHEFNPETGKTVWTYSSPYHLFSPLLGFVNEQDNGNLVITHITHGGSAFEVNKKKEIQWEWFSQDKYLNYILPKTIMIFQRVSTESGALIERSMY